MCFDYMICVPYIAYTYPVYRIPQSILTMQKAFGILAAKQHKAWSLLNFNGPQYYMSRSRRAFFFSTCVFEVSSLQSFGQ